MKCFVFPQLSLSTVFMNTIKAVQSKLCRPIVFFSIIHLIPIHEYSPCVSLAVIREGQRVPEAHHGAAQGEGLRLRDL